MKYNTNPNKQLRQSALYEVWCDMCRRARQEYEFYRKHNINRPYPIAGDFKLFDSFAMWARFEQGYEIGRDDRKELARIDIHEPYSPNNCHFLEREEVVKELDILKSEITKGASGVIYKDSPFGKRWLGQSKTRLYNIWKGTCRACTDPLQKDYPRLGGKGIRVYDLWAKNYLAFEDWAWEHGYTDQLSLTRIDKTKDFTPKNCRWETPEERCTGNNRTSCEKIRLSAKRMREYLSKIDDLAICTLIISTCNVIPIDGEQDDFPPTPIEERIDAERI